MILSLRESLLRSICCWSSKSISPLNSRLFNNSAASRNSLLAIDYQNLKDGFVICKMNNVPVNKLNLTYLEMLKNQFEKFEADEQVKGVILASECKNVYCAGLDITEMYPAKSLERGTAFWKALQDYWIALYGSKKFYLAAINGHAPAGGCLKAISCDYRIMSKGNFKIGLNETILGVKIPFYVAQTMINTIGQREGELALQLGTLYSGEEAFKIRLIDQLVDPADLMNKSIEQMKIWCSIPNLARQKTKQAIRGNLVNRLKNVGDTYAEQSAKFINRNVTQETIGNYWNSLKTK